MENKQVVRVNQVTMMELMSMGKTFYESGMFGDLKSAAQAFVKIQAGQEIGIEPFAAMSGIHIINGKPTIGAGIIASRVKKSLKYDYKVKEMTDNVCLLDFYEGDEFLGNSKFTMEDAKKAGTKNTDKYPRNMLFARAISNGVKWYCPDVFDGPVYVPEEMGIDNIIAEIENCETKEELRQINKNYPGQYKVNQEFKEAFDKKANEFNSITLSLFTDKINQADSEDKVNEIANSDDYKVLEKTEFKDKYFDLIQTNLARFSSIVNDELEDLDDQVNKRESEVS